MSNAQRYQLSVNVIYETIANETVIINLENGRYYSLSPCASFIWEELMHLASVSEIAPLFAGSAQNSEALTGSMVEFIDELISEGLVTPAPPGAEHAGDTPHAAAPLQYETPRMDKFTDMEELIPLDPIHQVGTLGWPYRISDDSTKEL